MVITALAFFAVVFVTVKPLGAYMDAVFAARRTFASRVILPFETTVYRICRIDPSVEMTWKA